MISALSFCETGLFEHLISTGLGHCVADDIHGTAALKGADAIGRQRLSDDLDRLVFETVFVYEVFRSYDATCGSVLHNRMRKKKSGLEIVSWSTYGGWAAHEFGQLIRDLWCLQNLFDTPSVAELGVWIVQRVFMIL